MDKNTTIKTEDYDALNRWRQDVGIKTKDNTDTYCGSCDEEDTMVRAIRQYERATANAQNQQPQQSPEEPEMQA